MTHPRDILKAHGLFATKRRGQNYLLHSATARAIAGAAGLEPRDTVVEIGAGLGALTLALAPLVRRVIAVEVDRGVYQALLGVLDQSGIDNVQPLEADALDLDWEALAAEAGAPLAVVGNLPYSVSSPLIFNLLEARSAWRSATLLLQKELVTRLSAAPGGRDYGRLTVLAAAWCNLRPGTVLGPEQFFPRPRVDSQLITLTPRPIQEALARPQEEAWFSRVVKAAFSQRRKTLANSLAGSLGLGREMIMAGLKACEVDPMRRAETLSPEELAGVARALASKQPLA